MKDDSVMEFGWTWVQKLGYTLIPLVIWTMILLVQPTLTGIAGLVLFVVIGAVLGVVTWHISSGWTFRLNLNKEGIEMRHVRRQVVIPWDRVGMLLRNGGFPFPTLWLVLRNAETGTQVPERGVDPQTRALIGAYQRRNPGKKITVVTVPGGHLRSISELTAELKRRIPPLSIDERLGAK